MNPRPVNISRLPKAMQRIPAIRALSLAVYPKTATSYYVLGREQTYVVDLSTPTPTCECIAAQARRDCAHVPAAIRYHERLTK